MATDSSCILGCGCLILLQPIILAWWWVVVVVVVDLNKIATFAATIEVDASRVVPLNKIATFAATIEVGASRVDFCCQVDRRATQQNRNLKPW